MYVCPECGEEINPASEICPRCGADLALLSEAALATQPSKKRSVPRLLMIWASVIAVLAGGIYGFVWYALPKYSATDSPHRAEARAIEALQTVNSALSEYASAEGHFPGSFELLGARGQIAAQAALGAGYTLQYSPRPSASDGVIHTYSLMARPARYGLQNFYTDQTGAIRATRENRAATTSDPNL